MSYLIPAGAMLLTQTTAAMGLVVVPVLATELARATGMPATAVGPYTALLFVMAMVSSGASASLIARLGPIRSNQIALVGTAGALLLTLSANPYLLGLSALALGLSYGPNTPSGSSVLARVTPIHRRALVFSIKQSGATIGAVVAGLMLPALAVRFSWETAVASAAALILASACAIQPLRARFDGDNEQASTTQGTDPFAAARALFANSALRALTAAAFLVKMLYITLQTYVVAYLVETRAFSLQDAGFALAMYSSAGAGARILLGWLADRIHGTRLLLGSLALLGALATAILIWFAHDLSREAVWIACFVAGIGCAGWYGIFLAEIVRVAPGGDAAAATGGALFFIYGAIVAGPLLFGILVAMLGSYEVAWWTFTAMGVVAAVLFIRAPQTRPVV